MNRRAIPVIALFSAAAGLVTAHALPSAAVRASDHDDGETEVKARNLNLTDLYVFKEEWQTNVASATSDLILVMNSNPRSVARQQYYFSDEARYDFHLSRVGTLNSVENDTPADDVVLSFDFDAPSSTTNIQQFTLTATLDGASYMETGATTTLAAGATPTTNSLVLNGSTLRVFAGLREDPFFFDVERFFQVRAAAGTGFIGFRTAANAIDFAAGYNVNSIVVAVPTAFLAGASGSTVFDVWTTISLPGGVGSVN